jgi:hypothetical protein
MNFYIKKDSTLPTLKYSLDQEFLDKYGLADEDMNDAAVTFSMYNVDTEEYHIANVSGQIKYRNDNDYLAVPKYSIEYEFKLGDTAVVGNYYGEFKLDFLNVNFPMKISIPNSGYIDMTVFDSLTKTSLY